jgi:hypothetical protein
MMDDWHTLVSVAVTQARCRYELAPALLTIASLASSCSMRALQPEAVHLPDAELVQT